MKPADLQPGMHVMIAGERSTVEHVVVGRTHGTKPAVVVTTVERPGDHDEGRVEWWFHEDEEIMVQ